MKKLLLFTVALVIMLFSPVQAANVSTVKAAIVKHSVEMGVDPAITLSIAKKESGFRQEARSPHGAVGVFQLMPSTARRMGYNAYTLDGNVKAGISYYKSMYKMFGSMELALAAYNAGPGTVKRYGKVPPFAETKRFVSLIMADYRNYKAHPDPAMIAAKKEAEAAKAQQTAAKPEENARILAQTPEKTPIPQPMTKIEQVRHSNTVLLREIPTEAGVKSQSVSI